MANHLKINNKRRKTMKHVCKQLLVVTIIIAILCSLTACFDFLHTHTYSEWGSNKTHHWKYCPDDNERDESSLEKHYDSDLDGKCDACGHEVELPHVHDYSKWASDADNHWKVCPDDNAKDASSVAPHADENNDGKCDVCGADVAAPVEEYLAIDEIDGVPTLVVKGPKDDRIPCVRLHAEGNNQHYYWNNTSAFANGYEFKVPLTDLPTEGTPWYFFHIYVYSESSPSDATEPASIINLLCPNGTIEAGTTYKYNHVHYTVIGQDNSDQLVIQPVEVKFDITSMEVKAVEDKLQLVIKGTVVMDGSIASLAIHTDGNGAHYYGTNVAAADGELELLFDLTQLTTEKTPWCWFHIYFYDTVAPDDLSNKNGKLDIKRGSFFEVGASVTFGDVKYEVQNNDQLVIQPKPVPKTELTVESIALVSDDDGKPVLKVTGSYTGTPANIRLHADATVNDVKGDYYGDNVSEETGKFDLRFDLTQIPAEGTPWAWFHIYTYANAASAEFDKIDLARGELIEVGANIEYDGITYTVQDQGQLVIQPK